MGLLFLPFFSLKHHSIASFFFLFVYCTYIQWLPPQYKKSPLIPPAHNYHGTCLAAIAIMVDLALCIFMITIAAVPFNHLPLPPGIAEHLVSITNYATKCRLQAIRKRLQPNPFIYIQSILNHYCLKTPRASHVIIWVSEV